MLEAWVQSSGVCPPGINGHIYEALAARLERRPARDRYHSALQIEVPKGHSSSSTLT